MTTERTSHDWSGEAIFSKSQRYAEEMLNHEPSSWQFGFWSSLLLEMLARGSLATISPALIADGGSWTNIAYAVGRSPNEKKFIPRTANASKLLVASEKLFRDFTPEMRDFALSHLNKRNDEVHSGALAFEGLGSSTWLPMFYTTCKILITHSGETLESLLGSAEASTAIAHIKALQDEKAQSIKGTINAHQRIWEERTEDDRSSLKSRAKTLAMRQLGHRVTCPACSCVALLHGSGHSPPKTTVTDDGIVEKQTMLPASFECFACGLKINGYSKLVACGLGDTFTSTSHHDALEYFGIEIEEEYRNLMWDDNNE